MLAVCLCVCERKLGASEGTINQEIQRYQQLESVAVNDIRRDVRKKLRRSSMRVGLLVRQNFTTTSLTWGATYKATDLLSRVDTFCF